MGNAEKGILQSIGLNSEVPKVLQEIAQLVIMKLETGRVKKGREEVEEEMKTRHLEKCWMRATLGIALDDPMALMLVGGFNILKF
ncbi:hypothetical protein HPP92_019817 [Vanilla planifolia]|uniref:Uncharacterized protein n=1 Tax=Vanilla planifolia TaxID=51239 RepID=A0A835UJI5_VANPL|nr:hypothetical protein HPP92_019817 [Vanilla planifolia]